MITFSISDQVRARQLYVDGHEPDEIAVAIGAPESEVREFLGATELPAGVEPPAPKRRAVDPRLAAEHMRIRAPKRQNNALTNLAFGSAPHSDDPCLALHLAAGGKVVNRG